MDDSSKKQIDLIDCYRLAVDFGKPAAENAIAAINASRNKTETNQPKAEGTPNELHQSA